MRRLGLFALVAVLATGCSWFNIDYRTFKLEVEETRAWPAAAIAEFSAKTENGGITITVSQADSISAEVTRSCTGKDSADAAAHIDDIVVTDNVAGTTVTLEADMPTSTIRNYGASFDMMMPAGIAVDLKTTNGAIGVTGTMADVDVKTSNGSVGTDGTRGQLTLESSNGAMTVKDHIGSATVGTTNGGINCNLNLPEVTQSADLETTNGNVILSLPADAAVNFDASTSNGSVTVEGFASVSYTTNNNTHKAGTIGGGGATVEIGATNGNVTIRAQ